MFKRSIVRQLDSPILLHEIEKKLKLNLCLRFSLIILYSMYFNVSSVNLKENKKKFRNPTHLIFINVAYKTVGLSSCRTSNRIPEKCYIYCRSKMNSIKTEIFDGVYWKL